LALPKEHAPLRTSQLESNLKVFFYMLKYCTFDIYARVRSYLILCHWGTSFSKFWAVSPILKHDVH